MQGEGGGGFAHDKCYCEVRKLKALVIFSELWHTLLKARPGVLAIGIYRGSPSQSKTVQGKKDFCIVGLKADDLGIQGVGNTCQANLGNQNTW